MSELIPLEEVKRDSFSDMPELFRYDNDQLTAEQQSQINENVNIRLYFGSHGTDAEHYLAVEQAFDDFDPSHTIVCFEGASYSVYDEKETQNFSAEAPISERMRTQREAVLNSRNSRGNNYLLSMNAFGYAKEFCKANGYNIQFVDIDKWTSWHWAKYMHDYADVANDPILDEVRADFFSETWQSHPFIEAALEWLELHNKSTATINTNSETPLTIFRWRQFHQIREQAAVNKIKSLALELAEKRIEQTQIDDDVPPYQVAVFFGAGHQRGFQGRLSNLGLKHTCVLMSAERSYSSASDVAVVGDDIYSFAKQWASSQLYELFSQEYKSPEDVETFSDKVNATLSAMDELSLASIQEFYETYRSYLSWYHSDTTPKSNLHRHLMAKKKLYNRPEVVFQNLLSQMFQKEGKDLNLIIQDYTSRRMVSSNQLFGRT